MDCHDVSQRSSAAIDGELPPAEAEALARHIAGCAGCARKRRLLEDAWRAFVHLPPAPVSAVGFDAGVRRRLQHRDRRRWSIAAAAAVLAAALVPSLLRETGAPPSAGFAPTPAAIGAEVPDRQVGLDCGLPGARVCVADTAAVVLAQPSVSFTASH